MKAKTALGLIIAIASVGVLFSGYLSYRELFMNSCQVGIISCGQNTPPIAGIPACVIGLVMYAIVWLIAVFGLRAKK